MGDGSRRAQMENRFGLGQPVDTYGEPCPHVRAANQVKETAEALFRGKAIKGQNLRVELPNSFIEKMKGQKGVVQVESTNPITGDVHIFYKALRSVVNPEVNIPTKIMGKFKPGQEIILKINPLPLSKFIEQLGDEASKIVRLKEDDHVTINLGGKEFTMKLEDLKYDYANNAGGQGGSAYIAFVVNDISGKAWKYKLYDNGMDESRLVMEYGNRPRPIEKMSYNSKRDALSVEYYDRSGNRIIPLLFREPPDEIDLDAGMAPQGMIDDVNNALKAKNTVKLGEIGEKIAAKIAEEKLKAVVFKKKGTIGPDRKILLDGEPAIIEAKFMTYKLAMRYRLEKAKRQIYERFRIDNKYRKGVAVSVYFDKKTGFFDYIYEIVPPENRDTIFNGLDTSSGGQQKHKKSHLHKLHPSRRSGAEPT